MTSIFPAEPFGGDLLHRLGDDLAGRSRLIGPYHDRTRTPHETLDVVRPLLPDLGITRVGLLTGLDVIGIPVAFATRPNSRSLSVFQGKGIDVESALASATMEAFESAIAEILPEDVSFESLRSVGRSRHRMLDLERTARCVPDRIAHDQDMPWCRGLDLMSGNPVLAPWWLVGLDHREPRPAGFEQSSDGLASGNTWSEAVLHGLCELIERDAWTLFLLRSNDDVARLRVDPRSLGDPVLDTLVDRVERAGLELFLADMTSDLAVPAYAAVLVPKALPRSCDVAWSQVCGGFGCHPLPVRAAIRAVTEAAQSRLTLIAGSRDDLSPRQYRPSGSATNRMAEALALASAPAGTRHPTAFNKANATIQERIEALVGCLRAAGIAEVIAVPMGDSSLGAAVVRVIAPGLEIGIDGDNVQLGVRAARRMLEAAE